MDVAVSDFEDAPLAFRYNENPDLISSDMLEDYVPRLWELGIDRCRPPILECLEVFPDELVGIQVR
ncbi:hypothetical protein Pstu01_44460 [Stutzerimonas stutzeri]|nr:hypothetical protein Pstu01_44460 [Stutzerimonas stutzeri]